MNQGVAIGGKGLEAQCFLWGLDSKQKFGNLNQDLIHTYFLIRGCQLTEHLVHGRILFFFFFFFVCFLAYIAFATDWSNPPKRKEGQESGTDLW